MPVSLNLTSIHLQNVQKLFMEMDSELYDSVAEDYEHSLSAQEVKMAAETQWEAIEAEIGGSS